MIRNITWLMLNLITVILASCTSKQKLVKKSLLLTDSLQQKQFFNFQEKSLLLTDSSQRNYEIEVWPKGIFTYGDAGYTGEAYRLKVKGTKMELTELAKRNQLVVVASEKTEVKKTEKHKTAQHKLKQIVWWPYLCVLLMLGAIYLLIRKIKA